MKKYRLCIVSALVGAALMFGIQAGAAGLLNGSKVAGTKDVTYKGHSIGQAAIINNTSYLPVRSISEALGLGIDLSGGKINLTESNALQTGTADTQQNGDQKIAQITNRLKQIEEGLTMSNSQKEIAQKELELLKAQGYTSNSLGPTEANITLFQQAIDNLTVEKISLETQLKALQP